MRNKYLLLGAASTLMLAACSEDINQGPDNNRPVENALNLTSLSPASQAGRVSLPGQTRGQKSERLQLVAKIAPVTGAALNNWSATGIAIANGNAYVSWHSNRQAQNQATAWGGAIDVLDINALTDLNGAINPANVITGTQVASSAKFNGIVADGDALYLPITSYTDGAQVGRWTPGAEAVDTITIPGVSANSIDFDGNTLYAVSGYKGGLYSFPTADFGAEDRTGITENFEYSETFGGKYISGGLVLRSNDEEGMQILDLQGNVRNSGNALVSAEKQAENYNPSTGDWVLVEGTEATHYGKHTMAVDGNYRYVGGGQGSNGENGLRVYTGTGLVWQNGTNTTAVTVAEVGGDKFVFAATGAGLRVYEPFNGTDMPLFAFEVTNYDENGNAVKNPENNKFEAGTDAHSANFVAVDGTTGLIFVACGQSGVYVFKLDTTVEVQKWPTGFIVDGDQSNLKMVDEGETETFTVPTEPTAPEGQDFVEWVDKDGNPYQPGEKKELVSKTTITLFPVYTTHVYAYTLKFVGFNEEITEIEGVPEAMKSDTNSFVIPNVTLVWGKRNFYGWSNEIDHDFEANDIIQGGDTFVIPGDAPEYTLYGVWSSNMSGNVGEEEKEKEPVPPTDPVIGGEESNGKE